MKIYSKGNSSVLLIFLIHILSFYHTRAQNSSIESVNTEPIELYLRLVNSIRQKGDPDHLFVKQYFENPDVAFFNQRPGFDSLKFVKDLIIVYAKSRAKPSETPDEDRLLMEKYRQNEEAIKRSVSYLKTIDIERMVINRLRPMFHKDFRLDTIKIQYQYLFLNEGTGGVPGRVFNSALQTAYLPNDIIDVISAHEAYHTITNTIFTENFGHVFQSKAISDYEKSLLWYLEIVAEEGIADLIDKPVLASSHTQLSQQYHLLNQNEALRARQRIRLLDSLLTAHTDQDKEPFMVNILWENGGHIPGRYMAGYIRKDNFNDYLNYTGNPFQFFFHYNSAVKDKTGMPFFSEKTIAYLKRLEQSFIRRN